MKTEFILLNQVNGDSVNNKKVDIKSSKDNTNFSDFMDTKVKQEMYVGPKKTQTSKVDYKKSPLEKVKSPKSKEITSVDLEKAVMLFGDLSNSISKEVTSMLNISQEELEETLETFGFTSLDLLNKDNATCLFLLVNEEANVTDLITNEDLMSQYNSFMEVLEDMRENLTSDIRELLGFEDADVEAIVDELKENSHKIDFAKLFEDLIDKNENKSLHTNTNMQDQIRQVDESADSNLSKQDNSEMLRENQINSQKDNDSINYIVDNQKPKSNEKGASTLDQTKNGLLNNFSSNLNSSTINNEIFNLNENSTNGIFDISKQIIEQIKVKLQTDQTSIEMRLYPEHLGKLAFQVSTKSGILTASFTTENEVTKEIIESQLHVLKEQLNLQGLKVEELEVEVGISQFFTNENGNSNSSGPKQNQGRNNLSNFWSDIEEDDATENITLDDLLISYDLDGVNVNTVNYSA